MSGKFMTKKKYIIPVLTIVIIASQLCGCAVANNSELLQLLQDNQSIEIVVAEPINQEQGTIQPLSWVELSSLETVSDLRKSWDDTLSITGTTGNKNGMLYVNADQENEQNNTLRVALHNTIFQKMLDDSASQKELITAADNSYVDIEPSTTPEKALAMSINGYFNLLSDASDGYSNPDATLQRNEFMAMLYRAEAPVSDDIKLDSEFNAAVGDSEFNVYAQNISSDSYLDLESKSLNNMTYNETITRAEVLYTLVSRYFADDLKNVDTKSVSFTDAKDAGNIAQEQKFVTEAESYDYWKSYELVYAIQNADNGLPTSLYNALCVAYDKGILNSTDTRWEEGCTRAEAIQFIVSALRAEQSIPTYTANQGTVEGNEIIEEPESPSIDALGNGGSLSDDATDYDSMGEPEPEVTEVEQETNITASEYSIEEMTPVTMYATKACNVRSGPATTYDKVGSLAYGQAVTVEGKVVYNDKTWFKLSAQSDTSPEIEMVSSSLLSQTKPSTQSKSTSSSTSSTPSTPSTPSAPVVESDPTYGGIFNDEGTSINWGAGISQGGGGYGGQGIHAE